MAQPSITCPRCKMTSYNPNDILNKYCGSCCAFWEDEEYLMELRKEIARARLREEKRK